MPEGSIANAVSNNVYKDLDMTRYPEYYDERSGAKFNEYMMPWTNLKDYNMAEHINVMQDAIMALQKTLGEMAQVPANPVDANGNPITSIEALRQIAATSTVKDRLNAIERYDWYAKFDKRYGGPDWVYRETGKNATIQEHRHLGTSTIPGTPQKISLTEEVTGLLPKANLNLSNSAAGITGSDILVQPDSGTKISQALNEKISEKTGGTIAKDAKLEILGKTNTRWTREFDIKDATGTGNTLVADGNTLLGQSIQSGDKLASTLLKQPLTGMHHGRYVLIIRVLASAIPTANVLRIAAVDSVTNAEINAGVYSGDEFETANKYKTFYLIFDHNGKTNIVIEKLATTAAVKIRFDYAIVEPVHPAVFDR